MEGAGYRSETARVQNWSQTIASLPVQLTQRRPLTWLVTFKVKERGTGYRPEIASARVPKSSSVIASFPGQITEP